MDILEDKKILIASAIIFALMFFLFYPSFYHYPDEQTYLRNAYLLSHGEIKISDPLYSYGYVYNGSEYVSIYPPMHSILLIPFAAVHWKLSFLSGLLLHLFNFFVFYKILKKLGIGTIFSVLYLFFPALALLSTTLQSEMSSITFALLTLFFYLQDNRKSFFLTGIFSGLLVLTRYTNFLFALALLITSVLEKKGKKNILLFLLGMLPSAIIVLAYNTVLYGSPFATAYSLLGYTNFSFNELFIRIPYYVLLLSAIYPLMFFTMFAAKNRFRNTTIMASAFFLVLWGSYLFFYPKFRLEDFVIGPDKFLPMLPLFLLCYSEWLEKLIKKFELKQHLQKITAIVLIILLASCFFVMHAHKQKQDEKLLVFEKIYAETGEGALIIVEENFSQHPEAYKESPFTGMFFTEYFGDRKVTSVKDDYGKYIENADNTFFMRIWMDPTVRVEITPYTESPLAQG